MVNVYDGDSEQNNVMDLKWAVGQTGRKIASAGYILTPVITLVFLK